MIKRLLITASFFIAIIFYSCDLNQWYQVPDEFRPYINDFDSNAEERGYQLDLMEKGLIVEFGKLEGDTTAKCHYEDPIRIEVDKEIWRESNHEEKQEIIFRYMALGFLNRHNKNKLFPNGEWTSLMRGKPYEQNTSLNVNFYGIRKDYYIDELFHENTDKPWWADYKAEYNSSLTEELETIYENDFLGMQEDSFVSDNMPMDANVTNGHLELSNISDQRKIYSKFFDVDQNKDFQIESIVRLVDCKRDACSGMIWGSNKAYSGYFTGFDINERIFTKNLHEGFTYFDFYDSQKINSDSYNKITIRKHNNLYYVFINEKFVYVTDIHKFYGFGAGFSVSPGCKLIVDRLRISVKK